MQSKTQMIRLCDELTKHLLLLPFASPALWMRSCGSVMDELLGESISEAFGWRREESNIFLDLGTMANQQLARPNLGDADERSSSMFACSELARRMTDEIVPPMMIVTAGSAISTFLCVDELRAAQTPLAEIVWTSQNIDLTHWNLVEERRLLGLALAERSAELSEELRQPSTATGSSGSSRQWLRRFFAYLVSLNESESWSKFSVRSGLDGSTQILVAEEPLVPILEALHARSQRQHQWVFQTALNLISLF